jgi:hypothetical protein
LKFMATDEGRPAADGAVAGGYGVLPAGVHVVKSGTGATLSLIEGSGSASALVWPGMGARHRSLHYLRLDAGARTIVQEHDGEAVYGILAGEATIIDLATNDAASLTTGAMVHVDGRTRYQFEAGSDGAVILGGPCPPDEKLYVRRGTEGAAVGGEPEL